MTVGTNPWTTPYVIYAFEFSDKHVYVGLTFKPETRQTGRLTSANGDAVFEHYQKCQDVVYKILQEGIHGPFNAAAAEKRWIASYVGWTLLNRSTGGELGGARRLRISDEEVLADAAKYSSKMVWKSANHQFYELARRRKILELATAHMPKIVRSKHSAETKALIKASLTGHSVSEATRLKISSATRLALRPLAS